MSGQPPGHSRKPVPETRRGAPVKASVLTELARGYNDLRRAPAKGQTVRASVSIDADNGREQFDAQSADETWTEVARTTETVRVTNPEDAEQYVDVERITALWCQTPDGRTIMLRFNNPA